MDLLTNQLRNAIQELLDKKGVKGSVRMKTNAMGEKVIAVILDEVCPSCGGTGKKRYPKDDPEEGT